MRRKIVNALVMLRRKIIDALIMMLFNCADTISGYALAFGRANDIDIGSLDESVSLANCLRALMHDENWTDAQRAWLADFCRRWEHECGRKCG
jgi:hypothetical protein